MQTMGDSHGRRLSVVGATARVELGHAGGEPSKKVEQQRALVRAPVREAFFKEPTARLGKFRQHLSAGDGRLQQSDPLVGDRGVALDKAQGFELGHLPADRRMVPGDQSGEIHDTDRLGMPDPRQQREKRPVQLDARSRQEGAVKIGPVHVAVELQEYGVDVV